jgi:hypothetical protein
MKSVTSSATADNIALLHEKSTKNRINTGDLAFNLILAWINQAIG